MSSKAYELKRALWVAPLCIAFFGSAAYFFFHKAILGNASLSWHGIRFSSEVSLYLCWILFILSLVFVALGVFLLFTTFQGARVVTLTNETITVPKFSLRGVEYTEIPIKNIHKVELFKAGNGIFLNIHHAEGKATLAKQAFQINKEFDEVGTYLYSRVNP